MRHVALVGLLCAVVVAPNTFQQVRGGSANAAASSLPRQTRLRAFLRRYVGPPDTYDIRRTRYLSAFVDLRGRGAGDAIVYLMGPQWCGSGGCTTLVLAPHEASYRVVTYLTITQLPIRVLERTSHGWHDMAVWVQGGIQPGYEALLRYNGKTYPSNPSVPPARRLTKRLPGKVVIPRTNFEAGKPLYP